MAELRPHYIDVDLKKNTQYNVPVVTQNDTATHFIIRVTDDGLTDPELLDAYQEITMTSQRPDGESFYLTGTRVPGTNEIEFHLGTDETAFSGSVLASLQFYLVEDASRYTSAQFRYDVKKDLTTNYTPTQREETLVEVVLRDGPGVIQEAKAAKVAVDGALVELEQDKTAAIERLDEVTEENKTVFRQPVNTFADLATTYPNPEHGTTVRVTSEAAAYRFSDGTWVKTDEYNPTAIDQVTAQLAETSAELELKKADKTEVDAKFSNIGDAKPSGVYGTLVELQTAFPAGNGKNIYLVSADGKWYYWSGTVWTSGGVYQSTGMADGSISLGKLSPDLQSTVLDLKHPISLVNDYIGNDGWKARTSDFTVTADSEKFIFTNTGAFDRYPYAVNHSRAFPIGHKVYVSGKFSSDVKSDTWTSKPVLGFGNLEDEFIKNLALDTEQVIEQSAILTVKSPDARIGVRGNLASGGVNGGSVNVYKGMIVYDLTEAFGYGNEPTLEEFEKILSFLPKNKLKSATLSDWQKAQTLYLSELHKEVNEIGENQTEMNQLVEEMKDQLNGNSIYYTPTPTPDYNEDGSINIETMGVDDLYTLWESLIVKDTTYITKTILGKDQSGEFDIWRLDLKPLSPKYQIIIQANIHGHGNNGDPRDVGIAIYHFFKDLVDRHQTDPHLMWLKYNVHFIVLPCGNPWGFHYGSRLNSRGIDLNRDFGAFSEIETQYVRNVLQTNKNAIGFLDMHCFMSNPYPHRYPAYHVGVPTSVGYKVTREVADYLVDKNGGEPQILANTESTMGHSYSEFVCGIHSVTVEGAAYTVNEIAHSSKLVTRLVEWYGNIIYIWCKNFEETKDFVMSPNGTKYRITVSNSGTLTVTPL